MSLCFPAYMCLAAVSTYIHSVFAHLSELDELTGIAAILRFPLPNLEDESDESDYVSSGEAGETDKKEDDKAQDTNA